MSRITEEELLRLPRGRELLGSQPKKAEPPPTARRRGVPNKWEQSFRVESPLMGLGLPTDAEWLFEPVTFTIGVGRRYTPDWCLRHAPTFHGQRLTFIEVKGSRQAKNARDGLTRLRVCAAQWPMFRWGLAEGGPGNWRVTWISGQ